MCGIVGAYGKNIQQLRSSLGILHHRGPDGRAVKETFNASLGHSRLAIIDVAGGQQPISNEANTRWLACNGEIYNYPILKKQFTAYPFQTDSDNEIILALYEQYGNETASYLDGMFAFAVVSQDELYLARDPLGIKPLYYGWQDETLYFASEAKALQDLTTEVLEFPPGHWYTPQTGLVKYYDLAQEASAEERLSNPNAVFSTMQQAVNKRLMSDVPLGVFLSGGLDSSIIAALVCQEADEVDSFAVGLKGSKDLFFAQQVADYLGTRHHEVQYTTDDMIEALPDIIYYLESYDPALVRSAIPNYFLARLASEHVTVVLSGEGADELFAGYHYLKDFSEDDLHDELVRLTSELHSCNLQRCDRMTMAHGLEGRVPFLDTDTIRAAFSIPADYKISRTSGTEKWILRKAFEDYLPDAVVWREKEQFSLGAGSAYFFAEYAETAISDDDFLQEQKIAFEETGQSLESKEALLYYREFRKNFPQPSMAGLVDPWSGTMPEGAPAH